MKFKQKLKTLSRQEIWQEYCGFLEISIEDYMFIQNRLMEEQIALWSKSGLGRSILKESSPKNIEAFRAEFPMTRYEDYADVLLSRRADMLPSEPVVWIETTWEGGLRPIKVAPYSRSMLDTYKNNVIAVTMLASGRSRGHFSMTDTDRVLYGGAPLPYATGLLPSLLSEDLSFKWLPDSNAEAHLSFSQRIKKGFQMALSGGVDYFFAISSVANYITENFSGASSDGKRKYPISPRIAMRYLKAKLARRKTGGNITPGEVFRLKGFVATGTDAGRYKERLAEAWGVVPIEIAAGTESTCIASETWEQSGMVFFPDACFYEFIPQSELQREQEREGYIPRTCLMDSVCSGESYELVISVLHGGAFMRYRIGDVYNCVSAPIGGLPRFRFEDRVPEVIDIAGFTRITEKSINEVIRLSRLTIGDWLANKEFDSDNNPYFHLYVEIPPEAHHTEAVTRALLTEHLAVYFKYFDSDYNDLKRLLNMEPLKITILKYGTIQAYQERTGRKLRKVNPSILDLADLNSAYRPKTAMMPVRAEVPAL
ncbi:MAG: GH3 auxin-responsive promoter family protein [Ruminococcaceae bacterium]|nr:GH3 auxin-responsive promoter family protein [Oscillospiraceae bacterium]